MNHNEIAYIVDHCSFPDTCIEPELIETHISWVIKTHKYVFKIKKPVNYGFLDFSNLDLRQYYCRREVLLNTRLTEDVYLGVIPVMKNGDEYYIGQGEGEIVDYAVMMKSLQANLHMPEMLKNNKVSAFHIRQIARILADFHKHAKVIRDHDTGNILWSAFQHLSDHMDDFDLDERQTISYSNDSIKAFIGENKKLFAERVKKGWIRDCHGDLHTGNIFLYIPPVIFDCIEFNDEFREIDILNELAFLAMDLEFNGKADLSQAFITHYQKLSPCFDTSGAQTLFQYYKLYRANVRAKVNILQAIDPETQNPEYFHEKAHNYVRLMQRYLDEVDKVADICSK